MVGLHDASVEVCLLELVFWWNQGIVGGRKIWYLCLFVLVMAFPFRLKMVLTMKWYVMASISIGFSCLLSKSYGLMVILSLLMISINFSNDLFYFAMSDFEKFLFFVCVLNTTDGFNCTYICTIFTTFIDLVPRGIGILKQFKSDASVAASNALHAKRGGAQVPAPVTTVTTKNFGVDVPRKRAVGAASLGRTISVGRSRRRELEELACRIKQDGNFVVAHTTSALILLIIDEMDGYLDGFNSKRDGINCVLYTVGIEWIMLNIYYVQTLLLLPLVVSAPIEIGLLTLLVLNTDGLSLNLINASLVATEVGELSDVFVNDGCRREEEDQQIEQVVFNMERATPICDVYDGSEPVLVAMGCLMVYLIVNSDKFGVLWCNIKQYMSDNYLFNILFTQTIFTNFTNTFVIIIENVNDTVSSLTFVIILGEYIQVLISQTQDLVQIHGVIIEYIRMIGICTMRMIFFKWQKILFTLIQNYVHLNKLHLWQHQTLMRSIKKQSILIQQAKQFHFDAIVH